MRKLLTLCAGLAVSIWAADLVPACDDLPGIDVYAKQLSAQRKTMKTRWFGKEDTAWRGSKEAEESEGTVAIMYSDKSGRVAVVSMTIQTESGDWVLFADYYFRPDGSLAKMSERLNTFYGDATVVRDTSFGCNGRLLRRRTQHLDLKTQKPKRPSAEFIDERAPVFRRANDLPFPAPSTK